MKFKSPQAEKYVCASYCSFYKPKNTEEFACQGLLIIQQVLKENPEDANQIAGYQGKPFQDLYPRILRRYLCQRCEFLVDGCDFAAKNAAEQSPPCGGYIAITHLLQKSPRRAKQLLKALLPPSEKMALGAHCTLKILERPYLYDIKNDELYELDATAVGFLQQCDGIQALKDVTPDADFLEFCLKENLLVIPPGKVRPRLVPGREK